MKTVKNINDEIKRVTDKRADEMVSSGEAVYVPKSEYKKIKDAKKVTETIL